MLKPIHRVGCSPALAACQQLMQRFALWLCDANVHGNDVTLANLQAQMPGVIEGAWLWTLIAGTTGTKQALGHARTIADLPDPEKQGLAQWVQSVANLAAHFDPALPAPASLPVSPPNHWGVQSAPWSAFKALMAVFYEDGLKDGLPYQSDGAPTGDAALHVTYEQFTREFREAHRLDPHPHARQVCVFCGRELILPAVDHWMGKAAFPLLAVCADNLLPVCSECNEPPQKGQKPVHIQGSFADWFHPYLRHANGALALRYEEAAFAVRAESNVPEHSAKVANLDRLLNLGERWTREFKAEYRRQQREIEQTCQHHGPFTPEALQAHLTGYRDRLSAAEPNFEVHREVAQTLLQPSHLMALLV